MRNPNPFYLDRIKQLKKKDDLYPSYNFKDVRNAISAYGIDYLISNKLKLPFTPKSFAFWIHGWVWGKISSPSDLLASGVEKDINILVRNDNENNIFINNGYKNVFSVGLPFLYVDQKLKERKKDSLLVFPPHSTNDGTFDKNNGLYKYLEYIKNFEKDFSEIGISLYGLDFKEDILEIVKKFGFQAIPGADWNDRNALSRLRYNLDKYEYATTNNIGSHMVYSLYAGQKFSFTGDFYELDEEKFYQDIKKESHNAWTDQSILNTLEKYSIQFVRDRYQKFFVDKPLDGILDVELGKREIGFNHKLDIESLRYFLGWNLDGQIHGISRKIFDRERGKKKNINKKQLTKGSKFTDEKIIFFVDTYAHLQKAKQLIGYFHEKKIFFITNKKQIYKNLHGQSRIFFKSRIDLFRISRKMKKTNHSYVVARVDEINFQILYHLSRPSCIYTFDEGLFSIRSDSIYNAENFMLKNYGYRLSISNLIFNFPKNASYFYKNTKNHFTWFNKKSFKNTQISQDRVIEVADQSQSEENQGIKIFIGQPWKYMSFSSNQLNNWFALINEIKPDLYLMHPRESINEIEGELSEDIVRVFSHTPSEYLCNMLGMNTNTNVYTLASTVVTSLHQDSRITLIRSRQFPSDSIKSQDSLIQALDDLGLNYEILHPDQILTS